MDNMPPLRHEKGDTARWAWHRMSKARVVRVFIACPNIVDNVQCYHLRTGVFVMHQPQPVIQSIMINLQGRSLY